MFLSEFENYQKTIEAPKEKDSLMDSYYLVPYLKFVKDHQKLYKIYIKNPLDFQHKERDDIHFIAQFIHAIKKEKGGLTREKCAIAITFIKQVSAR